MNFCSHCGSSDLAFIIPEGDHLPRYCCSNCGTIHYTNPNVVVGCLATWEGKILLAKRAIEPRLGFWNLPAGYLENGETVEEGAAREMREETNATVEIVRLHCVYNLPHVNQLYMHFYAKLTSPTFSVTSESSEVALFAPEDIPWDEIAFTSSTFALQRFLDDVTPESSEVHLGTFVKSQD